MILEHQLSGRSVAYIAVFRENEINNSKASIFRREHNLFLHTYKVQFTQKSKPNEHKQRHAFGK